jgi:Uma2 family endonuclease
MSMPADERLVMFNVPWSGFEAQLELRGERRVPRVAYLDGALELMSPSINHEGIAANIGSLVVTYALERGIDLQPYRSWLLKREVKKAGVEPDECFVFGEVHGPELPDLAIEVIWTHGGIDKLEIYRRLGVSEVWFWRKGAIAIFALRDGKYEEVPRSVHLPDLDLPQLLSFAERIPVTQAIRAYRDALRAVDAK